MYECILDEVCRGSDRFAVQDVLGAATASDSARRAESAAQQKASDAAAQRALFALVKRLTAERQAWAPPDSAPVASTASTPRRNTPVDIAAAVATGANRSVQQNGHCGEDSTTATSAAGGAAAMSDRSANGASDTQQHYTSSDGSAVTANGATRTSNEQQQAPPRVSEGSTSAADSPHFVRPQTDAEVPGVNSRLFEPATRERVCAIEDNQRRCIHMEVDHDYVRYTDAEAEGVGVRGSNGGSTHAHTRSEAELRNLPKGAKSGVLGGNVLHGEYEEAEEGEADSAGAQGDEASESAAESLAAESDDTTEGARSC